MKKYLIFVYLALSATFISQNYSQTNHIIQVANFQFTPSNLTITVGDTVTFQWVSGSHTTTSDSTTGNNSWDVPINSTSKVFQKVITTPGLHRYYCIPHGGPGGVGMSGTITANALIGTGVAESSPVKSYSLGQNFPNPFNPSTKISYYLPEASNVTLKIFNSVGQEIRTLINSRQSAGQYVISFDASVLSSGIYFYRLQAGNFLDVKKMNLIK